MERIVSCMGLAVLVGLAWLLSNNRRKFPVHMVIWGVGLQVLFCVLVLGVPALGIKGPLLFIFTAANAAINATLDFTLEGSRFVFGDLLDTKKFGFILAVQVLPTIIFIGALMSVLYHLGVMQRITYFFAWVMQKTMKTSGAETLAAAANIFVGQTEAPLVIKPFVARMTQSELLCLMIGGMANTAGGVMAAYVGLLRDRNPEIAGHLLTASIISAPAALLMTKIMYPETSKPETYGRIPKEVSRSPHANIIDAAASGASEGLTLALNVAAMLIAFIALIALGNAALSKIGDLIQFGQWGSALINGQPPKLTLQYLLGLFFSPLAWCLGIPAQDISAAGALLGEKTVLNEFVAYVHLSELGASMSDRSFIILSYALSGFANFSSIAIQVGGIAPLAPERRADLARLGIKAVIGGTLATLMTGAVVGLVI
ncbi:MAG: NupC/NupG family nucleoside CNT transporter [Bdellovibrionales bacterium]